MATELDRGMVQRLNLARFDRGGIGRIVAVDIGVEAFNEFGVGDRFCRRKEPGGGDDRPPRQGRIAGICQCRCVLHGGGH